MVTKNISMPIELLHGLQVKFFIPVYHYVSIESTGCGNIFIEYTFVDAQEKEIINTNSGNFPLGISLLTILRIIWGRILELL